MDSQEYPMSRLCTVEYLGIGALCLLMGQRIWRGGRPARAFAGRGYRLSFHQILLRFPSASTHWWLTPYKDTAFRVKEAFSRQVIARSLGNFMIGRSMCVYKRAGC